MKKHLSLKKTDDDKNRIEQPTLSEENFKIYLRVKPNSNAQSYKQVLKIQGSNKIQIHSPYYTTNDSPKQYNYEQVFNERVNNEQIFNHTMINPIKNTLQGYNSTVFIYGMTGAGKTYTMFGNIGNVTSKGIKSQEQGLVTMTIDYLFGQIQKNPSIKTQVFVSFYEIYNETIRDLLSDSSKSHQVMEDPIHGFFVHDLAEISLQDKNHTKETIISGIERRSMNATKSNEVSSRSHAILQFNIKRYIKSAQNQNAVLQSKFFMIDLAGNEKTSNNQSKRFIEGVNINKSLLTLGKCLNLLAQKKNSYIPFRQSKLTRILKESLGGNSKTVMIACVSSEKRFYEETLNTLKYSSIARRIKNKGIKHNIKILQHHQIPQSHNFRINSQQTPKIQSELQSNFKNMLSKVISAIEEKTKIQMMVEELEESRLQNQRMIQERQDIAQLWIQNINNIDQTIEKLMKVYDINMQKAENAYQMMMKHFFGNQRQNKSYPMPTNKDQQVQYLHDIIAQKNSRIQELEDKVRFICSQDPCEQSSLQHEKFPFQTNKIEYNNLSQPVTRHEQLIDKTPHRQTSQSSEPQNRKKLTINCIESGSPRGISRQCSRETFQSVKLNTTTNKQYARNPKLDLFPFQNQKEITITLTPNLQIKQTHQSSCIENGDRNKEQFVRKLKEAEKKAKMMNNSAISSLIGEQEENKYTLNNIEQSMLRKLRFFQKENRMKEKSSSLSHYQANKSRQKGAKLTVGRQKPSFSDNYR